MSIRLTEITKIQPNMTTFRGMRYNTLYRIVAPSKYCNGDIVIRYSKSLVMSLTAVSIGGTLRRPISDNLAVVPLAVGESIVMEQV